MSYEPMCTNVPYTKQQMLEMERSQFSSLILKRWKQNCARPHPEDKESWIKTRTEMVIKLLEKRGITIGDRERIRKTISETIADA